MAGERHGERRTLARGHRGEIHRAGAVEEQPRPGGGDALVAEAAQHRSRALGVGEHAGAKAPHGAQGKGMTGAWRDGDGGEMLLHVDADGVLSGQVCYGRQDASGVL